MTVSFQFLECFLVLIHAVGLIDGFTLPFEAKPTAIFKGSGVELALASGRIEIFVPVKQGAAGGAAAFLGDPKSARMAHM